VLNGMVEGVLVIDAGGDIILANSRLREIFNAWGEVLGRTPLEAIRDAELDSLLSEACKTDQPVSGLITLGGGRTLNVHAVRFPPGDGPRMGTVAVFHDVSELSRLEKVRRDFVANASHELRTPLSAIRGFAETILSSDDLSETEQRSYVQIIHRHARRLGNIVGDLLELSEREGGATAFELAPVDVAALADALIRDARPRFEEKQLDVSLETEGPTLAWADARAVEQVLTNLLNNAVQYTDTGGRIQVSIEGAGDFLVVRVSDSGIGIPERDRDRIFERFYRVDKARSRALGGTGLGLSIVKHLVQGLGGEISVESELGKGSTFRFTLPVPRHVNEVRGVGGGALQSGGGAEKR
jgi:two-component system phosphate regulon sensor histidine kinase PhoR